MHSLQALLLVLQANNAFVDNQSLFCACTCNSEQTMCPCTDKCWDRYGREQTGVPVSAWCQHGDVFDVQNNTQFSGVYILVRLSTDCILCMERCTPEGPVIYLAACS